jgi:hypothetical protein
VKPAARVRVSKPPPGRHHFPAHCIIMAADTPHMGLPNRAAAQPPQTRLCHLFLTPSPVALAVNLQFPLNWIWWVTMAVTTFALSSLSEICIYYLHDMKEIALVSPFLRLPPSRTLHTRSVAQRLQRVVTRAGTLDSRDPSTLEHPRWVRHTTPHAMRTSLRRVEILLESLRRVEILLESHVRWLHLTGV